MAVPTNTDETHFFLSIMWYPYIYNRDGIELHCLKEHGETLKLQFLKKHFLLASINDFGQLHYQDITTGLMVNNYRTGLGRTDVMQVNPFNNVLALGHSKGIVTMWKPTSSARVMQWLCHQGPISALAFHAAGHLMATAGMDRKIKLWDLRMPKDDPLQTLRGHATSLDFSQKGLLATATGSFVQVLGDLSGSQSYSRYMNHPMAKGYQVKEVRFRPYEDVLGIGHSMGCSSILIPGAGEPNFDSWVANPFETAKQRREKEIRSLLDKLPPETIMLDPGKIGTLKPRNKREKPKKEEREAEMESAIEAAKSKKIKKKTKGRSKPSRVARKKQEAVADAKRPFLDQETNELESSRKKRQKTGEEPELRKSLQRFARKKPSS